MFKRLKKHYQKSCEKLTEIFEECIQQLAKVADDDPLIGDLEKSIPGFKFPDTLREHVEKLLNPECKILVTGERSSTCPRHRINLLVKDVLSFEVEAEPEQNVIDVVCEL